MQNRTRWSWRRRLGVGLLVILTVLLVTVGYLALVPPNVGTLASHPNPATSYEDAMQRVAAIQAQEAGDYNPLCQARVLTHGQKTPRVIAFIHGYTNCPNQFAPLGQQFYDLGYNVLLIPMPHQGLADLMTDELSKLTAEEMAAYADQLVDISVGLGDHVTVAGLSQGGVVAGWSAQTRSDLDLAVLIAPGFGLKLIPSPATVLAANVVLLAPESYQWWDPLHDPKSPPPTLSPDGVQGYPRYSLHGLAQQLRLAFATEALARRAAPAAKAILLVTNANDLAVDNGVADQVVADWRAHGGNASIYDFPKDLNLYHDLISPQQSLQRIDIVYPKLIEPVNGS